MGDAIGQLLTFAVAVSLSPFPIIGVVLMLATPRGRRNGPAFILGWVAGLTIAGTITLLLASGADAAASDAADGIGWVRIGLGLLLLYVAAQQWRGRPKAGDEPKMPSWMASVDHFGPPKAAGLGVLLSAANPKTLLLVVGAGLAIAQAGVSTGDQAIALAVFVVLATVGPALPVAIAFLKRDQADRILGDVKDWMTRSNAAIMTVLCLLIAAKLIGDGIAG